MTAQDLKNSILQLAVQGKLVPQDPSDEPSSELLKRIRTEKARLIKEGKLKREKDSPYISEEEKLFDIPNSWCWTRLNDICSIVTGKKDANFASENGKYNFFTCAKEPLMCDSFSFCGESLLLAGNGDISNISYFVGEFEAYQRTYVLQPYIEYTYLRYLFYHLQYNWVAYNGDKTFGSAIPYIRLGNVQNYLVALPPLAEQKRIIAKIEELLPLVESYGEAEERLMELNTEFPDKLRKSILQQAVQGKLTERDPLDEPASELLKRIHAEKAKLIAEGKIKKEKPLPPITDEEKPFDIPDTWEWIRLTDVGEVSRGKSKHRPRNDRVLYDGGIYPLIQTGDVARSNGKITKCTKFYNDFGLAQSRMWSKGTLCMTIAANIADVGILDFDACFPDSVVGFNAFKPIVSNKYFLYMLMAYRNVLDSMATKSAQKNINLEIILSLAYPLPPLAEQERIVARVEELLDVCDGLK